MNSQILKGKWNQVKGNIKEQWGNLTDDDIDRIEGRSDQLVGLLQERYGKAKDQAEKEVDEYLKKYD